MSSMMQTTAPPCSASCLLYALNANAHPRANSQPLLNEWYYDVVLTYPLMDKVPNPAIPIYLLKKFCGYTKVHNHIQHTSSYNPRTKSTRAS